MKLTNKQIRTQVATLDGWRLRGKRISKFFVFEDFMQGVRFLNRVAKLAEAMNHHPDIDIRYNKIKLSLTTHDEGGLTMRDFKLARNIDRM
ncbi:hypothetical protein A3K71_03020 [archaeon RBG_16_50_20]|nr:MAG: hypothetical protein A3K71_03020 [archaeon RBG_16_50_20]